MKLGSRQPAFPARRARAGWSRGGPRRCERQLHHPPVRRPAANAPGSRSRAIFRHRGHPWRRCSWKPRPRSKATPTDDACQVGSHPPTRGRKDAPGERGSCTNGGILQLWRLSVRDPDRRADVLGTLTLVRAVSESVSRAQCREDGTCHRCRWLCTRVAENRSRSKPSKGESNRSGGLPSPVPHIFPDYSVARQQTRACHG
jgi:hypothetical protein